MNEFLNQPITIGSVLIGAISVLVWNVAGILRLVYLNAKKNYDEQDGP